MPRVINHHAFKLVIFLVLLGWHYAAFACQQKVRVGINEGWPPYVIKQPDKFIGVDVDIIKNILSAANYCVSFVELPSSSRTFEQLKKGTIDMLFAASYTKQRADFATFTEAYREEVMRLYAHRDSDVVKATIEHILINKGTIGINLGSFYGASFSQLVARFPAQIAELPLVKQRFDLLNKQRLDYVVEDELSGRYFLKQRHYVHLLETAQVVHRNPVYFMFRQGYVSSQQLQVINQAINANKEITQDLLSQYQQYL
ncbi:ABC transporter substrate-binding protein [Pseudoalteromonas sp. MMG012]|uniref:substrate-binding periplasmic protein n=1 Tax=Pseudoalteromonas sp. MMG012 TaxID=2822686 RepID=UPI001B3A143B|nr:transporter substrate-binding domain-containing protein [Pseudoalteromonas sp. MMG012]MBQ4850542.1 transporter substrate-binding domain-containing protein [Pseudoalteromonas sp. MMG012]